MGAGAGAGVGAGAGASFVDSLPRSAEPDEAQVFMPQSAIDEVHAAAPGADRLRASAVVALAIANGDRADAIELERACTMCPGGLTSTGVDI